MLACIAILFSIVVGPSSAADVIIKDGDTLRLGTTLFRLEGIDAPETASSGVSHEAAEYAEYFLRLGDPCPGQHAEQYRGRRAGTDEVLPGNRSAKLDAPRDAR